LGTVAGMRTKFQLYTVPGQVYYDATRKLVLQGCDGIVFVADSNPDLMAENIESLDNLAKNLRENGLDIMDLPIVLQYNKRDLPTTMTIEEMNAKLNRNNWPTVEAVAVNGDGVFQTLKAISQGVIKRLNREQGYSESGQKAPRAFGGAKAPPASTSGQGKAVAGAPVAAQTASARVAPPAPKSPTTQSPRVTSAPAVSPRTALPPSPSVKPPVPSAMRPSAPPPTSIPRTPVANVAPPQRPESPVTKNANPFRERMVEIKKQSSDAAPHSNPGGDAAQSSANSDGGEEQQPRKGCLAKMFKGGAAATLFAMAVAYWFWM